MATTNKVTANKLVLGGVQTMILTPYTSAGALSTSDHYELLDIVENTTTLTKEEGSETQILNEQGGVIKSLFTAGTRTFTANTGDLQESVLIGLFGFVKESTTGRLIEPSALPEIFVQVEVTFGGGNAKMTCPKVQLNPSLTIESLKEGIAQGVITGTALDVTESVTLDGASTATDVKYSFSITPLTSQS